MKLIFDIGDVIIVDSYGVRYKGKGQIVALRHAIGNYNTGSLSAGADVLCGDGKVRFFYLHDIAGWNKDKLTALA